MKIWPFHAVLIMFMHIIMRVKCSPHRKDTNINIDLNINVDGCGGVCCNQGKCETQSHQIRNRTTMSGVRIKSSTARTAAIPPRTAASTPRTAASIPRTAASKPLSIVKTGPNFTVEVCLKQICIHICDRKGYPFGFCLDPTHCFCYNTPDPESNVPMDYCLNAICRHECEKHDYLNGTCIDFSICHCYDKPSATPTILPARKSARKLCTNHDCNKNCSHKAFRKGVCEGETCYCHDSQSSLPPDTTSGPPRSGTDLPQEPCELEGCSIICKEIGFSKGTCADSGTCHCYGSYTAPHCTSRTCKDKCNKEGFREGFCKGVTCYCHDPQSPPLPDTTNSPPGLWTIPPREPCKNEDCSVSCKEIGFSIGDCADSKTCHCYGLHNPLNCSCIENETCPCIRQRRRPLLMNTPTSLVITHYSTSAGISIGNIKEWEDVPMPYDCLLNPCVVSPCKSLGYSKGFCLRSNSSCHCYDPYINSGSTYGPHGGWSEKSVEDNCLSPACVSNCEENGFSKGGCATEQICHCYDFTEITQLRSQKLTTPFDIPDEYLDMRLENRVCTKMVCRLLCKEKRFSKGFCIGGNLCHCYDPYLANGTTLGPRKGWKNEPLEHCMTNICALKCRKDGLLKGVCMDVRVCHCYKPQMDRQLRKLAPMITRDPLLDGSLIIDVPVCMNMKCRVLCRMSSFRKGRCENDKKCVCFHKATTPSPMERRLRVLKLLPNQINNTEHKVNISPRKLFVKTRDPKLDMFTIIIMEGCVPRKCRWKCKKSNFRKSHCEGNKCYCHEKMTAKSNSI